MLMYKIESKNKSPLDLLLKLEFQCLKINSYRAQPIGPSLQIFTLKVLQIQLFRSHSILLLMMKLFKPFLSITREPIPFLIWSKLKCSLSLVDFVCSVRDSRFGRNLSIVRIFWTFLEIWLKIRRVSLDWAIRISSLPYRESLRTPVERLRKI